MSAPPGQSLLPAGLQLDPVVLDAAGQLIGFWAAEQLSGATVVFPVGLAELVICAPARDMGPVTCLSRSRMANDELVFSDIDVLTPEGTLWLRLSGWADKRFLVPAGFDDLLRPASAVLSRETTAPLRGLGRAANALTLRRLDTGLTTDLPFWNSVWAARLHGRAERARWTERSDPAPSRLAHLAGRAAAKDAVAALAHVAELPADIEISNDVRGRPVVCWDGPPVQVSIAHTSGTAVALAGTGPHAERLGVDVERRGPRTASFGNRALGNGAFADTAFADTAFGPSERDLLAALLDDLDSEAGSEDEWALRFWCAKEALGKAVGTGLVDGPGSVTVEAVDRASGQVVARLRGSLLAAAPDLADTAVLVATWADDLVVVASTTCSPVPFTRSLSGDRMTADREVGHDQ